VKVVIANAMAPFIHGGAEALAEHLAANLARAGHETETIRIPFRWEPPDRVLDAVLSTSALQVHGADAVIALKFPAYFLPHPNKRLWLLHQYRQAYDLWGTPFGNIPPDRDGVALRDALRQADTRCFEGIVHRFANSPVTQRRLQAFNGVACQVLRPPVNDPGRFQAGEWGAYIFCGGRINEAKRQWLVAEAMRHTRSGVRILIAGPPDSAADLERLERAIRASPAAERIVLRAGRVTDAEIGALVSGALACVSIPVDEDSFSYVAMEACEAAKAVLTASDSGGVVELVADRRTGFVCKPEPRAIADALDRLWQARTDTMRMGRAAQDLWRSLGITWPGTIAALLA